MEELRGETGWIDLDPTLKFLLQAGTGDEFLDELLSNDASLDEGGVPDIKVMDSSINMSGNEVSCSFFVLFFF